jgi:hypothetical protein
VATAYATDPDGTAWSTSSSTKPMSRPTRSTTGPAAILRMSVSFLDPDRASTVAFVRVSYLDLKA